MKFFAEVRGTNERYEISEEKALDKVLSTYRDTDAVRDWLTIPNCITCASQNVYVLSGEDDGWTFDTLLLAGTRAPEGVEYDDDFNRIAL